MGVFLCDLSTLSFETGSVSDQGLFSSATMTASDPPRLLLPPQHGGLQACTATPARGL